MTTAWKGFRATNVAVHTRTRSAIVALIAIMATGACSKQDGAPPTESATASANRAPPTTPADQPAAPPSTIPEPFHGMWASTVDGCQAIETGTEPAVTITASEVRDVEYETFCTLHKVVSASATELVAEFICPTVDDQTPAPAPRTLALAAGRLVFQDRPVSYLRCAGEAPPPPVELAEPIDAPPPTTAQDVELKVPEYMTTENFVNFTWNSLYCRAILTEELRRGTVPPEAQEGFRAVAQMYRDASEELAKRAGLSQSAFADQRDREIPAEVRKVYELAGTSGDVRRGLSEQLDTCVKQSKTMSMLAMAIIYEDAKARESDPSKPAPAAPYGRTPVAPGKSDVTKPSIAHATQPDYPEAARRAGEQGTVQLDVLVLTTGGVSDVRIAKSSGSAALDEAAANEAQRSWTFNPGQENGRPVAMRHAFSVTFKLTDDESASGTGAGSPSVYRRCLTDPAGPKAFTEARLNRMGSLARAIDQYANGQYETYLRMRESYGYMERNPNGTPDSICSFADLIPVESFEKTLQQLQSNNGAR